MTDSNLSERAQSKRTWCRRLALGTVQFGLDYGISNTSGQVSRQDAAALLELAAAEGIDTLDTAVAYGNSEQVIGEVLVGTGLRFDIVSKLPPEIEPAGVAQSLRDSLQLLRADSLSGCLAHSFASYQDAAIRDRLLEAREQGLLGGIGVSVYFPQEVEWLLDNDVPVDIIQLPFNLFDQRFLPLFGPLRERGVDIHLRSVFLQGLFFIPPQQLKPHFASIVPACRDIRALCDRHGIPLPALLLNFALLHDAVGRAIIGTTDTTELTQNLDSHRYFQQCQTIASELAEFAVDDEDIVIPYKWS